MSSLSLNSDVPSSLKKLRLETFCLSNFSTSDCILERVKNFLPQINNANLALNEEQQKIKEIGTNSQINSAKEFVYIEKVENEEDLDSDDDSEKNEKLLSNSSTEDENDLQDGRSVNQIEKVIFFLYTKFYKKNQQIFLIFLNVKKIF